MLHYMLIHLPDCLDWLSTSPSRFYLSHSSYIKPSLIIRRTTKGTYFRNKGHLQGVSRHSRVLKAGGFPRAMPCLWPFRLFLRHANHLKTYRSTVGGPLVVLDFFLPSWISDLQNGQHHSADFQQNISRYMFISRVANVGLITFRQKRWHKWHFSFSRLLLRFPLPSAQPNEIA